MSESNGVAADISSLGDKIAALTLSQAVQLKDYLKEKYKIEPAAGGAVMMAAGPAAAGPAEKPAEKTEFTPVLEGGYPADKKITIIKVIREITGLGLKEAKDLVEGAPKPVKENIAKDESEAIKKKLEEAGAKVTIK
jgi:large subunit ribosomal protein L7/L12